MAYSKRRKGSKRKKKVPLGLYSKLPVWAKKAVSRAAGKKGKAKRRKKRKSSWGF